MERSEETVNVLLLSDSLAGLVEPISTDDAHRVEVVGRAETARGEVALWNGNWVSLFSFSIGGGDCAID